ncbi:KPN_02809 family neutral zinc metallopeptidase [Ramlibacter albus]|uniref:Neutral zinc metallopeptidase n=1 Tax=Ramlibacter albus TaxID=2079448 RepID=A0A923S5E8_9BURK|nr:neutral zinc metallopeptidase [Ramlibacter albus]MBC5767903.1 neutral zinc metallopeptidase [Ramlibacter albus]
MRWEGNRESGNVEDMRSGGGGFGIGGGTIGIGTIVIALIGGAIFGINPLTILGVLSGGGAPQQQEAHAPPANDVQAKFVSTVLANTEDVWKELFAKGGATYQEPKLVLFRGAVRTGCGAGQAAMGPFYCPADRKVYIDLGFYDVLSQRLGAPGEFARAYVIAHEVGHHVQNLLGVSERAEQLRARAGSEAQANAISVRVELQADCYAGIWAHYSQQSKQWLEPGDIEAAMNAAQKIGDDTLSRSSGRAAVPESFTHGSSEQRVRWFNTGWKTGNIKACDTFSTRSL